MFLRFFERKHPRPSYLTLILIMAVFTFLYFIFQNIIGSVPPPACGIDDNLQDLTAGINRYLHTHPSVANGLMIAYALFGDLSVVTLFVFMILKSSCRPFLPLVIFMLLRQILQLLVSLPLPPDFIWHYPGFPSLFVDYNTYSDFYFSAYVGINLLLTLYLLQFKIRWLTVLGFAIVFFEAFVDLVLRSHYTTDIYTSIITAVFAFLASQAISGGIDKQFQKSKFYRLCLIVLFVLGVWAHIYIQKLLFLEEIPKCQIVDLVHDYIFPLTNYISTHGLENAALIALNFIADGLVLLIFAITLFKRDIRPFLTMIIFFTLRQSLQLLVKLPLPPHTIWHHPGFPSLMQTYSISSDLYFSGHTGTSLLAAYELSYFHNRWLTILGFALFIFEAATVVILQDHYIIDVFTAIMTVTCFTQFSFLVSPRINRFLNKLSFK